MNLEEAKDEVAKTHAYWVGTEWKRYTSWQAMLVHLTNDSPSNRSEVIRMIDERLSEAAKLYASELNKHLEVWEKTMMKAIGEDGPASVAEAIEKLKDYRHKWQVHLAKKGYPVNPPRPKGDKPYA